MEGFKLSIFLAILLPSFVILTPVPQVSETEALVIVTTETNDKITEDDSAPSANITKPPELKNMHVECNVTNRYAHTLVSSRYKNPADEAQEATFSIILPETAFISGFSMKIKDKIYEAYVKEKEEAKREYNEAVQSGIGAGYVEQNARDSNAFTVSINVEPRSKVTFDLSYEELLVRKHGRYEMVINLHPGQLVKDLTVDVNINETQKLVDVKTPALRSGNEIIEENLNKTNEYATITPIGEDGKAVHIHFAPTTQQQKDVAKQLKAPKQENSFLNDNNGNENTKKTKTAGIAGQFVVEYDVERNSQGGEILINDGYFVHFFAPPELKPLPKHAVFVLDVSGSMGGRKIEQLKEAMYSILDELKPMDYFNLVEFSFGAKIWNFDSPETSPTFEETRHSWWREPEEVTEAPVPFTLPPAFPATPEYKQKAKDIIKRMEDGGGTNIYDALRVAMNLTSAGVPESANITIVPQPIVVFLTDGEATDGIREYETILETVDELNKEGKTAIFSLSFGFDANKDFLKKLSLKNSGFMRQIYEASDASLQLKDFYKQISSPLLSNVTFKYPEGQVNSVSKHNFHTYFEGGEFTVAGKVESTQDLVMYVHGLSYDGPIDFTPPLIHMPSIELLPREVGPLERMWAYLTIKQLLDKKDEVTATDQKNNTEADDLNKKALKLALKYSFVTPVTSLVVVKPNETEKAVNTKEARQLNADFGFSSFNALQSGLIPTSGGFRGFGGFKSLGNAAPVALSTFAAGGAYYAPSPVFDSDAVALFEAEESPQLMDTLSVNNFTELPWLSSHISDLNHIIVNGTEYVLLSNTTDINTIPCQVETLNLNGTCNVLSACPSVYPKLDSYDTYIKDYFCALDPWVAGVCCIE